jgi:hypothetical protein
MHRAGVPGRERRDRGEKLDAEATKLLGEWLRSERPWTEADALKWRDLELGRPRYIEPLSDEPALPALLQPSGVKPCRKCGGTDRFPSGGCRPCALKYQRDRAAARLAADLTSNTVTPTEGE